MATKTGLPTTREELVQMLIDRKAPQARREAKGMCTYLHSENGGCAIGVAVSSATAIRMEGKKGCAINQAIGNKTLPKRLSKLGEKFLVEVQNIHDEDVNWWDEKKGTNGSNGLVWSKNGVDEINKMITNYDVELGWC
jgi:hypothetical protein